MTPSLTRAQVVALGPCSKNRIPRFPKGVKSMTAAQALDAGASIDDLLWVAMKIGRRDLCVRFALACAQRVAHLNSDPRVQAALDATQAWLDDPCDRTANAASAAAYAASAANVAYAYASNAAANAAAYAAYANGNAYANANAAASAANVAAYAAASAAYANASAASASEREAQRAIFLEIFS